MVLQDDAIEKELTLLKGFVTVAEGDSLPSNISINITDNENGELIAKSKPSPRNGSFVFIIPPGENYNISYEVDGTDFYNENIYVPMGSQYQEIEKEILLDPVALTATLVDPNAEEDYTVSFKILGLDIASNLMLKCIDEEGNLLYTAKKQADGSFKFDKLPQDQNYLLILDTDNGEPIDCEGVEIGLFHNDAQKALLLPSKDCQFKEPSESEDEVGKVLFVHLDDIPSNLKVQFLDDDGNLIYTEDVDKNGYFDYHKLDGNQLTINLISDEPCDGIQIKIVDPENESKVYTEYKASRNGDCNFVPLKVEKASFQEYFTYNKNVPQREKN